MEQTKTLKFEFNVDQINVVMSALAEIPYKLAAPVIEEIHKQAAPQISTETPPTE